MRERFLNMEGLGNEVAHFVDDYDPAHEREVWDRVLAAEPTMDKGDFLKLLQNMLDPQQHLAPAIKERVVTEDPTILFLTGVGQVFPYIEQEK